MARWKFEGHVDMHLAMDGMEDAPTLGQAAEQFNARLEDAANEAAQRYRGRHRKARLIANPAADLWEQVDYYEPAG